MAKTATKKKKPVKQKPQPQPHEDAIDILTTDEQIKFNIFDEKDQYVGTLEESVVRLHQICLEAQQNTEGEAYLPEYAKLLSRRYNLPINDVAAYRIANYVFSEFVGLKKS